MKTINQWMGVAIAGLLLTACHENPLPKETKTHSATFLIRASAFAERAFKLDVSKGSRGDIYIECMEEEVKDVDCKAFYKEMIKFAQSGKYPAFKNLTLADITDKVVFNNLSDRYEEVLFTRIDL